MILLKNCSNSHGNFISRDCVLYCNKMSFLFKMLYKQATWETFVLQTVGNYSRNDSCSELHVSFCSLQLSGVGKLTFMYLETTASQEKFRVGRNQKNHFTVVIPPSKFQKYLWRLTFTHTNLEIECILQALPGFQLKVLACVKFSLPNIVPSNGVEGVVNSK